MAIFTTFMVGLLFSYLGSIPPGMINISVLQYAMQNKKSAALAFTTAAVLVEFVYAAIAVKFQMYLTQNTALTENFQLLTAGVLIALGITNLRTERSPDSAPKKGERRNAFKRGTLISLANPLAIPFWLAVTIYLDGMKWIVLYDHTFWWYISGISAGTLLLLLTIIFLAAKYSRLLNNPFLVYKVPGLVFILMGLWSLYQWWI